MNQEQKLERLRQLVQADQERRLTALGYNLAAQDYKCQIKLGAKYARLDVGRSGKYMIDLATGEVFGIKGYGVIHRGHRFGTLDTIGRYDWSGYVAVPLNG